MNRLMLWTPGIALAFLIAACSSSQTAPESMEKVEVSQSGDFDLSCNQLNQELVEIEQSAKDTIVQGQKRAHKQFAAQTIANMTLALLSGSASANNRLGDSALGNLEADEKSRLQSLADRHRLLMNIAKRKECSFVPDVEARMKQLKQSPDSMTPALDEQSYRKRMGGTN